jgi:hypothetical protein
MEFADLGHFMIRERPDLIAEVIIALTQNSPMIGSRLAKSASGQLATGPRREKSVVARSPTDPFFIGKCDMTYLLFPLPVALR